MRENALPPLKRVLSHKYFPILILICINVIVGAFIVTDYGESWDEHLRYQYGQNSINAYFGIPGDIKDEKGPFFVMTAILGGNLICSVFDNCLVSDARHYINFLSFLIGLFFIYRLNLRFTNKWAALGGALLYNTQPLLWGHAFINPKDLPFVAFFIASIDTGFAMAEAFLQSNQSEAVGSRAPFFKSTSAQIIGEWRSFRKKQKRVYLTLIVVCFAIMIGLFISKGLVNNTISNTIQDLYTDNAAPFLESIFKQVAKNVADIPAESYIQKASILYAKFRKLAYLSLLAACGLITYLRFPQTREHIWERTIIGDIGRNFINPTVLFAGIVVGLTSSIRVLGPAAGALIALYLIGKRKKEAFPIIWAYGIIGFLVMYITWPGLWRNPLYNFMWSFAKTQNFDWDGKFLYAGNYYLFGEQPRSYLPVVISIQITLTAILPFLIGLIASITKSIKRQLDWMKVAVIALWFFVPLVLVVLLEPKIYDNSRHFLFILSPIFVFAAIGLQALFDLIKRPVLQVVLILVLILPNIFSLIQLHPYQYIYYNALTNGVSGAFRQFEMDYWGTSYREAAMYINQIAPPGAHIIVFGAPQLVETYVRDDLNIEKYHSRIEIDPTVPTFAILLSRNDKDIYTFPEAEVIHTIERDGAILTVIKDLSGNDLTEP